MALKEAGVKLSTDGIGGFLRNMGKATDSVGAFGKQGGVVSQSFGKMGGAVLGVGKILGGVFVAGVGAAAVGIGLAVNEAKDFEEQIAILGVSASDSGKSLDELSDIALKVGGDTSLVGVSASDTAASLDGLYKAGLSTVEIFGDINGYMSDTTELSGALRASIDLAAASEFDMGQASDFAATALATFGGAAETEAGRASFIIDAVNNLVQAADASVTSVPALTEALKYVGPTAVQAGLGIDETNNALAILSGAGIEGSMAGTGLGAALTSLLSPTEQSSNLMNDLGIEIFDATGAVLPFESVIGNLETALVGMTDEQKAAAMNTMFTANGQRAMNVLLESGVDGWNDMEDAVSTAATAQEQAAARTNTFKGMMEGLSGVVESVMIGVGSALLPTLTELGRSFSDFISDHGPEITAMFERLGAGLETVTDFISGFITEVNTGREPIGAFSKAVHDAFPPEVAAKIFVVRDAFLNVRDRINELVSAFQDGGIGGLIAEAFPPEMVDSVTGIVAGFLTLKTVVVDVGTAFVTAFAPAIETIKGIFTETETFQNLWVALQPIVSGILAVLGALFLAFLGAVVGVFTGIADAIQPFIVTVTLIATNITEIFTGIYEYFMGFFELVKALFDGDTEAMADAWQKMSDASKKIISNLVEGIVTFFVGMGLTLAEFLKGFVSGVVEFFTNLYDELVGHSIIPDMVDAIITYFEDMITDIIDAVTSFVSDVVGAFTDFAANVGDTFSEIYETATGFWADMWETISGAVEDAIAAITSFDFAAVGSSIIDGITEGVKSAAADLISAVVDAAQAALGAVKDVLGIESPSTVFAVTVGEPIAQGTALGVEKKSYLVQDAIETMVNPMAMNPISPVASPAQQISNVQNNSRELTINFEGNYASQPAVRDSNDLALILGMAGVSA